MEEKCFWAVTIALAIITIISFGLSIAAYVQAKGDKEDYCACQGARKRVYTRRKKARNEKEPLRDTTRRDVTILGRDNVR